VPADRPTRAHIAFFHAELLYDIQQWADCARAYERALDAARDAQLASDAAYGAVLCYDRELASRPTTETPLDDVLAARELTEDEARMARTFARFVCTAPSHEEIPTVLYRWARIHYEANQLDEAAVLFGRVAREHPRSEVAEYAANLYLDTVNMLATHRGRAVCQTHLAESIGALESTYCDGEAARARHTELCPIVDFVRCDAEARAAAALGRAGQHREAAEAYVSLVRRRSCEHEDRYLFNAAIEYEAARLVGRAIRVRTVLVDTFPTSPLAQPAMYYVGANYHALAMYAQAADWYERFAREPACRGCAALPVAIAPPDVARALEHALTFRLGLADRARALENARRFESLFARSDPRRTAEVVFAIGALYVDASDWRAVITHYRRFLQRYGDLALPHRLAQAHVLVARAHIASGQRDRARPELEAAVAIHAQLPRDALSERDRALLHDAASEALFELAEAARERFEALPFPTLRGTPSLARVNRWAAEELTPWLAQKLELLRVAEQAYERVHPLAVPRWRIASAARIGDMMNGLVERVRASPVPAELERDPELLAVYWEALDTATEPYLEVAVQRYEACLHTATAARWFDDHTRRCEEALSQLDAARFPLASELRGRTGWEASRAEAPVALELRSERARDAAEPGEL
jgi:tetratricopeptide (TPR) repeat protein